MSMLKFTSLAWVMMFAGVCALQAIGGEAPSSGIPPAGTETLKSAIRHNPYDGEYNLPRVEDLTLSSDGRYLAAAYKVTARNCPGTDWDAWVAVWDLVGGKRTVIPNATGPLAISPDGRWVVCGLYDRSKDLKWRTNPRGVPALWKTGDAEPTRKIASKVEPGTWLAWTFSADGNELLAFDRTGTLYGWKLSDQSTAEKIDTLAVPNAKTTPVKEDQEAKWKSPVDLQAAKNQLVLIATPTDERSQISSIEAIWSKFNADPKWRRYTVSVFKWDTQPQNMAFHHPLAFSGHAYALTMRSDLILPRIENKPSRHEGRPISRFAFHDAKRQIAFMEPDAELATVKINGEQISQFPAAAVHAFTPDGKQLITSDRRGILRFWDVAAGRIVRTLRLDDSPPDTFLVAAVQAASEFGEPEHNRKSLATMIERAACRGAQVVVLPETAVTGYMSYDLKRTWQVGNRPVTPDLTGVDPKDAAETVPGPSTRFFSRIARQWGIYLTVPLLEADRKTGHYYNTDVLLGPDGGTLIHYRKVNPWPWAEQGWASDGNLGHPVADTPFGRFSVLICYDIHKQAAELAKLKIDTLLYSIAWVDDKDSDWFPKRLPKMAAACKYNMVAANWTVPDDHPEPIWYGYGQSLVIDAAGRVLMSDKSMPHQNIQRKIRQNVVFAELPLPPFVLPADGQ
jgi:predicted amidohydrolase/WD40 repeat protein